MREQKGFGYEKLVVYWLATTIYDLTVIFCQKCKSNKTYTAYMTYRMKDQMIQAARSGKQNIVEGSIGNSMETNLKLSDVARNSFGELLEDYKDFLRQHQLKQWEKNDPRVLAIRRTKDTSYKTYTTYTTYTSNMTQAEHFANLMVTLCYKELYLLERYIQGNKDRFVREGGFRENLFKKRMAFRSSCSR